MNITDLSRAGGENHNKSRDYLEVKGEILAARLAACAALAAFASVYVYGITMHGLLLGVAFGWLPSGILAWLAANAVYDIAASSPSFLGAVHQRLFMYLRRLQ